MGYLAHIVLALVAQALSETGLGAQSSFVLGVAMLACVPHALALLAHHLSLRGRFKASEIAYRFLNAAPPVLYLFALAAFGWQVEVREWTGSSASFLAWPDWSLLVVFAPFLVYELVAIDARARLVAIGGERGRWRAFQMRMFASGLAPIAIYGLIASLIGLSDDLRVRIEEVRLWNALFATAMLGILGLSLPFLLENTWETTPLPEGPQKDLLLAVADLARFQRPRLYVWKTGHTLANAAIVGVTPRSRVVLFSDSLLAQMAPKELAAVFAHEMGHAFRRHVPIFLVWVLGFFMLGDLVAEHWFPDMPVWAGATVLAVMGIWFVSFGWLSRRFELEADLFSLDLLGETRSLISALEKVGGRLRDVASWRHFSTAERVEFLERAQVDRNVGRRLRRDLRRWTYVGLALFVATGALQVVRLFDTYPNDRVRADLRLGRYAEAVRAGEDANELEPKLAALVERSRALAEGDATLPSIARRALAALDAGDAHATLEWLELGALRGDARMSELATRLEESKESVDPELARRLGELARIQ
jgi:Zn-dependent protease with chaperone function